MLPAGLLRHAFVERAGHRSVLVGDTRGASEEEGGAGGARETSRCVGGDLA